MAIHYVLGALIFPAAYHLIFKRLLFGTPKFKSLEWAMVLWTGGQFVVIPSLKKYGYFQSAPDAKLTYLIGHLIYGTIFSPKKP